MMMGSAAEGLGDLAGGVEGAIATRGVAPGGASPAPTKGSRLFAEGLEDLAGGVEGGGGGETSARVSAGAA